MEQGTPDALWLSLLLIALLAPIAPFLVLVVRARRRRLFGRASLIWVLALVVLLALHPVAQAIFLEPLDRRIGLQLEQRALQLGLVGKSPEEVLNAFGEPQRKLSVGPKVVNADGDVVRTFEPYETWVYKQLPGYWFGSDFQVFFKLGSVSGFEVNDD